MLTQIATGLLALVALLTAWVTVQLAWRRVFPAGDADPDALAGRLGCQGRCDSKPCVRRCPGRAGASEEEKR